MRYSQFLRKLICVAIIFSVITSSHCGKNKKTKLVTTLLDARWEVTPIILEVAEYLSEENTDFFWNYVNSICNLETPIIDLETEHERYRVIIEEASKLLSPSELSIMKLGLSLHIYSPKVQMFHQISVERGLLPCPIVADVSGTMACGVEEMNAIVKQFLFDKKETKKMDTFQVDHHYPGSENNSVTVILYGELGTPEFARFHRALKQLATDGKIDYIIRHYVKERPNRKLRLSGYGVELQMKSTEYKAEDDTQIRAEHTSEEVNQEEEDEEIEGFNFSKLKSLFPDQKVNLEKFKQNLLESSSELAPLKVWQFQELSLQASQRIVDAPREEVLHVFTHIAQNFPIQAKSLVRTAVNSKLKEEIKRNQELFASNLNLQPSDTALFINGMFFDLDVVDVISLLEVLRQEQRTMQGLHNVGISNKKISSLLTLDLHSGAGNTQEFAIDIRDSAVNWINDIENDAKYRRWPTSLMELLRPTFPGMLRNVRKNLYNLVLIVNPAEPVARALLKLAESFYVHTAPLRVGLVFAVSDDPAVTSATDAGVALLCAFNYITQHKDAGYGLGFITDVYAKIKDDRLVTVEDVISTFKKQYPKADTDDIFGEDSDYDFGRQLAKDFVQRTGLKSPMALMNGIPLSKSQLTADEFEEAVLTEVIQQTPAFQKAVYKGEFLDHHNAVDYIMDKPNVMPRLNQRILNQDASFYLDMSGKSVDKLDVSVLLKLSNRDLTATAIHHLKYFSTSKKTDNVDIMTHWIIGDLNCKKTRDLLVHALKYMKSNRDVRVTFIPNILKATDDQLLNKAVLAALSVYNAQEATQYVLTLLQSENVPSASELPPEIRARLSDQTLYLKMLRVYCQRVLSLSAGKRAVIANGRVLGPLDDNEIFDTEDFILLERHAMNSYGEKIQKVLKENDDDEVISSNQLLRIISLLVSRPQSRSRYDITFHSADHSVVTLPPTRADQPSFDISAIVDPVSRGAQKLGPILSTLQQVLNCNIRLFLNSAEKNSDMPLKSFYRFVLEPEIQFNDDGSQTAGPFARFAGLPNSPLLTQNMHVPENWLVAVERAIYDLDNIRLEDVESVVHSEYELEYLLLEGHCFEASSGTPPRGLQLTLGTETNPIQVDTIVMANLGYFQLKANPGAWLLRLRQGRSSEIYDIASHEGTDTPQESKDIKVLISSLRSHVLKLRVAKKPEMRHADLLAEDDNNNSGIWNSITSSFGSGTDEEPEEVLNIFSLASGHLYERFLRIMMLSVLKHTTLPVKFWFLKNYLSPQFKDFLPQMASEYGFEYELVEYKWPRWLHQQTEKQRIIWGYKILFLDVLFPLDVKKIIFVDADQIVRADMRELQTLDLGGAPYGYTPFCESRTEMDGFRFWKQGYWRNHLQGRRYHISALYVVDLKRFRRIAAGDRLRGQYQALSQDPNSLANLDQDLPNNMIHQVAIKSLPQEWLWCETWCDDSSKSKAKTIDLCNNPLTKEAKLNAAVRIVEEWKDYDNEIRRLQQKIESKETVISKKSETGHDEHSEL